ncbi:MAG: phosphoribosylformimino-5-aminoimidazole carboxamide ribotide isomerase [Chloroflexota bacterium]|nr:phosphoribosylformimino-5-aminoimidazole carboxamide ribotide isomerase [Chloroflexota bacterium]
MLKRYNAGMLAVKPGSGDPPRPFELLPAIDLRGGLVVRLREGDFARETVYGDDPPSVAKGFADMGASWLHVVDLDGARAGGRRQAPVVAAIVAEVGRRLRIQVGGGLRDEASVAAVLAAGAERVVIGSAALHRPNFVANLVALHGPQRVVVALDVRAGRAVGEGWRTDAAGTPVEEALMRVTDEGVEILAVTSIERDGRLEGPALDLLGRMVELGRGRIIASGGIRSTEDVLAVRRLGCAGAIVGRALYEGRLDLAATIAALATSSPGQAPIARD